ncbi:type II toxin-antitoxin system ParD family antitoxin [Sphingomonas qilianensis]|uniref:Type II toxin-antitoxin system ParD family antitoxin n=1 Tax=Sphingomonas qilianensis TaxID=1736690 RepID=A0ABU9XSV5_9SPHN
MNAVRTINVALSDELAVELDEAVANGEYDSSGEVIRELLLIWSSERAGPAANLERLRAMIREGLASGEPIDGNFDLTDIKRCSEARLTALRTN